MQLQRRWGHQTGDGEREERRGGEERSEVVYGSRSNLRPQRYRARQTPAASSLVGGTQSTGPESNQSDQRTCKALRGRGRDRDRTEQAPTIIQPCHCLFLNATNRRRRRDQTEQARAYMRARAPAGSRAASPADPAPRAHRRKHDRRRSRVGLSSRSRPGPADGRRGTGAGARNHLASH